MKVFWFFFAKKNCLRPQARKRFFLKKEAKTSIRSSLACG
jgi:hypothetical protein